MIQIADFLVLMAELSIAFFAIVVALRQVKKVTPSRLRPHHATL